MKSLSDGLMLWCEKDISFFFFLTALVAGGFLFFGCAISKINWDSRVGNYTFDQAVMEFGPPERSAKLSNGRTAAKWLIHRGRSGGYYHYSPGFSSSWFYNDPTFPDRLLRLTFSPEGHLEYWKRVTK